MFRFPVREKGDISTKSFPLWLTALKQHLIAGCNRNRCYIMEAAFGTCVIDKSPNFWNRDEFKISR